MVELIDDPRTGAMIIDPEQVKDPMLKQLLDFEDMKKEIDVRKLLGSQNEEKITGYYQEIGANVGAWVIIAEGEDWEWGNQKFKRQAIVGHFYKAVELSGGQLRVQFSSIDGATSKDGRWRREWDEHPLSAQRGGFIVPKRGGFAVMNDGWVIILSKYGILSGKNAWDFAEECRNFLFKERGRVQRLQEEVEDRNAQLQTLEEEQMTIGVERDALLNEMKDIRSSLILAQHTVNRLNALKDSLMTEIENWQDLDSFRRTYLSKMATDINKAIEGILMYVSVQKIDESLRAGMSEHPRITEAIKQGMMNELQKQGIATKTAQEKEVETLKRQVDNLSQQMAQRQQPQGQQQQQDDGGDDDGGESGGEDAQRAMEELKKVVKAMEVQIAKMELDNLKRSLEQAKTLIQALRVYQEVQLTREQWTASNKRSKKNSVLQSRHSVLSIPTKSLMNTIQILEIMSSRPIPTKNIYGVDKRYLFTVKRAESLAELVGILKVGCGIEEDEFGITDAGETLSELYGR